MKSVIYDANSFPYQAFGLKKTNLFPNENTVYSNKPSQDHNANVTISTFLSPKTLKLQTLAKTYQDESMSIVGAYTVVLSRNNQASVLAQLARFFGESTESLQKQTSQSRVGFVNYHLIILAVMILCLLLIMFAINFILPLHHIKTIGIKKLNGWSNSGIFWPEILENIGWIFGISFVVDIGLIIVFDFLPNLLMPTLICVQLVIVLIYLASHLMTYLVIKNMTIHHLAKAYYTFSSQSDYDKRFSKVSDILSLSNDQKNQLFDSGLDATGGSRIDNLGLTSEYQTATGFTSDLDNQTIESLATVIVETSGTGQKVINQTVLLHGWFDIKTQELTSIKINQIQ